MKTLNAIIIVVTLVFVFAGCQQQEKGDAPKIAAKPVIKLSVVARYIRNDSSKYITQQKYEIFSEPQAIFINAAEPYGNVVWSVQDGIYAEPKNKKFYDEELFKLMTNKNIAQGVLGLYLAGLNKIKIQPTDETLNFNGQVYECVAKNEQNVKIFRNKRTGNLDLVTSDSGSNGQFFIIFGYNIEKTGQTGEQAGFYVKKVDIYLHKAELDKKLLAQLNCSLN